MIASIASTRAATGIENQHKLLPAREIVLSDETLRTVFLLGHASSSDPSTLNDEKASRFLLWFALEGRIKYHHVMFSPSYLAFLSAPMSPCTTRLAAYLLLRNVDLRNRFANKIEEYHAWYYMEGACQFGLAAFITARERAQLGQVHPRFQGQASPLTRAQYYAFLNNPRLHHVEVDSDQGRNALLCNVAIGAPCPDRPATDRTDIFGVNVIGFGSNVMGIGEDSRALVAALGRAGIPRTLVNLTLPNSIGTIAQYKTEALHSDKPLFPINIYAIPPFETARLRVEHGAELFHRRYSIGYWPWELTSLPELWLGVFDTVDEIWAPSEFLYDVFRKHTRKPVIYMPPYLNIPESASFDHDNYGLGEHDLIFLIMFDFNSFTSRKNPQGAIEAFQRAFPNLGPERLVIKMLNAHSNPEAFRAIKAMTGEDRRFVFIHDALTRSQIAGLIARADCLISLHRAEGFGRVIAEAMALGTAVVATDWSGSTAFLNSTNGYPVSFSLRDIVKGEYVFDHGSQWAEPSMDDAVAKLREMRGSIKADFEMRRRARSLVRTAFGMDTVSAALTSRLDAISIENPQLVS